VGAIEFFSRELRDPDEELLASMAVLGSQIGQYVSRLRAEQEVRESESRMRAMLESALDAVVTMDHRGAVLQWNHAAESTFGYSAEEALGREMAELIVPPSLRAAHRQGMARYLESGEPRVLDRRLELTAMRADGSEFPVELTITRISLPGPPVFTAYLRDITERVASEAELRASRVRIVEAADAERRRIERNLHDGAQQHLIYLGLAARRAHDLVHTKPNDAVDLLARLCVEVNEVVEELRELAQGIHPAVLTERGLRPALAALAERAPVPVRIGDIPQQRLPDPIEVAVYYVVAEALANVAKHAQATVVSVTLEVADSIVSVAVEDDGIGGAGDADGSGLRGLLDRVQALGGTLGLESPAGGGTVLRAQIPLA
jgi:PAS domain S-box-containing protein